MAQPFTCLCKRPSCRGTISGAKNMSPSQLHGVWLNPHIRDLLEHSPAAGPQDALQDALLQAEKALEAARLAARIYASSQREKPPAETAKTNGEGLNRRGATSRELAGEMGGDTTASV